MPKTSHIPKHYPAALIPTTEAAEILAVSIATVNRWVRVGELTPAAKAPGLRGGNLFDRAEIDALAASQDQAAS